MKNHTVFMYIQKFPLFVWSILFIAQGCNLATSLINENDLNKSPLLALATGEDIDNAFVSTDEDTAVSGFIALPVLSNLKTKISSLPLYGTLTFNSLDNSFIYLPNLNYFGNDQFKFHYYNPNNPLDKTADAIFQIAIAAVNDAPLANNDAITVPANSNSQLLVLANDSDIENDPLEIISVSQNVFAEGVVSIAANHKHLIFTPAANALGVVFFTYTMRDLQGTQATAAVNLFINQINSPPVATNDIVVTNKNVLIKINVLANDTDLETPQALTLQQVTQPGHGTAQINTNNANSQTVSYTPQFGYIGTDSFSYYVRDAQGLSAIGLVSLTITNNNNAPVAIDDSSVIPVNATVKVYPLNNDFEPDQEALTITPVGQPTNGNAIFNAIDKSFTYTPNNNFVGPDSFVYQINDPLGASATATININVSNNSNVVNQNPIAMNDTPAAIFEDQQGYVPLNLLGNDADPENDALTIVQIKNKSNSASITIIGTGGQSILYKSPANYFGIETFTYVIQDAAGNTAEALVTMNITPVEDNPTATNVYHQLVPNITQVIPVSGATDLDGDQLLYSEVTTPANGVLVPINNASGVLTGWSYTPNVDFEGIDSFTYRVTANSIPSNIALVSLHVSMNHAQDGISLLSFSYSDDGIQFPFTNPSNPNLIYPAGKVEMQFIPDQHSATEYRLSNPSNEIITFKGLSKDNNYAIMTFPDHPQFNNNFALGFNNLTLNPQQTIRFILTPNPAAYPEGGNVLPAGTNNLYFVFQKGTDPNLYSAKLKTKVDVTFNNPIQTLPVVIHLVSATPKVYTQLELDGYKQTTLNALNSGFVHQGNNLAIFGFAAVTGITDAAFATFTHSGNATQFLKTKTEQYGIPGAINITYITSFSDGSTLGMTWQNIPVADNGQNVIQDVQGTIDLAKFSFSVIQLDQISLFNQMIINHEIGHMAGLDHTAIDQSTLNAITPVTYQSYPFCQQILGTNAQITYNRYDLNPNSSNAHNIGKNNTMRAAIGNAPGGFFSGEYLAPFSEIIECWSATSGHLLSNPHATL
jgi:hypothetical protein